MKRNDLFPSDWMKVDDVGGGTLDLIIGRVVKEQLQNGEEKPVVHWKGDTQKPLILNRTNFDLIADLHGDDTDDWKDKPIRLYAGRTQYQGTPMLGIRVREATTPKASPTNGGRPQAPAAVRKPAPTKVNPSAAVAEELNDEIPFDL